MNNTNNFLQHLVKHLIKFKNIIHHNPFMIIGCYGILIMLFMCTATHWLFHANINPIYEKLLPPAWQNSGDVKHFFGTDEQGHDIFNFLLLAYRSSIFLTLVTTCFVVIIGIAINYIMFFFAPLRPFITLFFRVVISFPPMLSAIVAALLWNNNINTTLVIIGLAYLPRFVHNVDLQIMQEWQKTYITAHRLDGIPTTKIINLYIVPNILSTYLTEIANLFSHIILTLTVLTFLGFGNNNCRYPDLGQMMHEMLTLINYNFWAFFVTGIVIIITILLIHLVNLGLNIILTKKG